MKDFVGILVERSEAIRSNRVNPKEDNMLMVTNEGRKAESLHDSTVTAGNEMIAWEIGEITELKKKNEK